ncbi:MAG TPA: hypothetical protein VFB34_01275 [Chloroflexota bacterium]|nr:hypothetical protein [Chloroflexota bacterium]
MQLKRTPRGAQIALVMLLVATVLGAVAFYYARFTLAGGIPIWSTEAQAATWLTLGVALPLGAAALLLEGGAGVGREQARFRLFAGAAMLIGVGAMLASLIGFGAMVFVITSSAVGEGSASCTNGTNTCLQPWVGDAYVAGTLYLAALLLETAALIAMLATVIRARKALAGTEVESD